MTTTEPVTQQDFAPPEPWPPLTGPHFFGVERPGAGTLVHIWRRSHTQGHTAACGTQRRIAGVQAVTDRAGLVLCHQCRVAYAPPPPELAAEPTLAALDAAARSGVLPAELAAPSAPESGAVVLKQIRTDGGTQARAGLNQETVAEYTEALTAGATFPPIVVYHDGADYWLADGFHRVKAYYARGMGLASVPAEVRSGTRRDAVLYACGANAAHGLRRTRGDVQRAIEVLLRDAEWVTWSDREIARTVACDHKTVGAARERLASIGEIPQSSMRTTADGRQYPAERAAPAALDPVLTDMRPRAEKLGLSLDTTEGGEYVLSGGYLAHDPAIFIGRYGLEGYLTAREKEAAKTPPPPVGTMPTPTHCASCGAPFKHGRFGALCGPCFRGETQIAIAPEPPMDPQEAELRSKAGALGLTVRAVDTGFQLYWPDEESALDLMDVFPLAYALWWVVNEAPHMPRAKHAPAPAPAAPELQQVRARVTQQMTASEATTAAAAAELREANNDNPAWAAGAQRAEDLVWEIVALLENDDAPREPVRALHAARQLVASLELETAQDDGYVSVIYRRLAEWEQRGAPLNAGQLLELDDVTAALEDLSGVLDDASYDDLASRLSAVRSRGKAAA